MSFENLLIIKYMDEVEKYEVYVFDNGNHPIVTSNISIIPILVDKQTYDKFILAFPEDSQMPSLSQYTTLISHIKHEAKA